MSPDDNPFRPTRCGEDYRLTDVPRDASGAVLWRGPSGEDYENYLAWLADYLHANRDVELSPKQAELRECAESANKQAAAGSLGMHAAYYDSEMTELDIAIHEELQDESRPIEALIASVLNHLAEYFDPGDTPDLIPERLSSRYTQEDVLERIRERESSRELHDLPKVFCDMPWRVPLAVLLRDVSDKEQRVRCLRRFFVCYQEESRK